MMNIRRIRMGAFGVGAGAGGLLVLGADVIFRRVALATAKAADNAFVIGQQLALSAQAVQEIEGASDLAGTKFGEVRTGIRRMVDNAGDFVEGSGQAVRAFQKIGITTADIKNDLGDTDKLLMEVVKRIGKFSGFEQGNILAQIMGRAGGKNTPLFGDLERFIEFREFVKKSGAVIGPSLTDASQKLIDQGIKIKFVIRGIRNDLAELLLIPVLTNAAETTVAWWLKSREAILEAFRPLAKLVRDVFFEMFHALERIDNLVTTFTDWGTVFSTAAVAITAVATALLMVAGVLGSASFIAGLFWFKTTMIAVLATFGGLTVFLQAWVLPVLAAVAALTLLFLVFEDLLTFVQGGESVFGHFLEWLGLTTTQVDSLAQALGSMRGLLTVDDDVIQAWGRWGDKLREIRDLFVVGDDVIQFWSGVISSVGDAVGLGGDTDTQFRSRSAAAGSSLAKTTGGGGNTTNNTTTFSPVIHGSQDPVADSNRLHTMQKNSRAGRER